MSVFRNIRSWDGRKTHREFLRQAKPNVAVYPWKPQRDFYSARQPNEKRSFFEPGSNASDQNHGDQQLQQYLFSQPQSNPMPPASSKLIKTPAGNNYGVVVGASGSNYGASGGGAISKLQTGGIFR